MDLMSSPGISVVKVSYEIRSMYTIPLFPRVVFNPETFPLYKETQLSVDHPAVQDLLYYPLFLTINNLWSGWRLSMVPRYQVQWSQRQLDYIEHQVELTHGQWESEPICTITDSLFDGEGTQPLVTV